MLKTTDFFKPTFHLFSNVKSVIYLWLFNISSLLLLFIQTSILLVHKKDAFLFFFKQQKCDSFECFF